MSRNGYEQRRRARSLRIDTAFRSGDIRPVVERDPYEGIPKLNAITERWLFLTNVQELDRIGGLRAQRDNQISQRQRAGEQLRREWTPTSWV